MPRAPAAPRRPSESDHRGTISTRLEDAPPEHRLAARKRYTESARATVQPLIRLLVRLGVTPNALTVAGLAGSAAAAALILTRHWVAAGIVFVLSSVLDMLDGSVARLSGKASPFGAFLDSTFDRLAEALIIGAIGVTLAEDGHLWAVGLAFGALTGSFLVSYTRARAEGLGIDSNRGGLMSRPERLVLIGAAIFFAPFDPVRQVAMAVLCGLTLLTVAQRLWHVRAVLDREGPPTTTTHQGGDPTP